MIWGPFKNFFFRNWKEKLLALVLAFLFWYMIRAQAARPSNYGWGPDRLPRSVRL